MFDQVFASLRTATEASVSLQQEMFKKWIGLWPGTAPASAEQVEQFHKRWAETVSELLRRQGQVTEAHFQAGLQNIDQAFQIGEVKDPVEFRARTIELWKKCFDSLRQGWEAQARESQVAFDKWFDLLTTAHPTTPVPSP